MEWSMSGPKPPKLPQGDEFAKLKTRLKYSFSVFKNLRNTLFSVSIKGP